MLYEVSKIIHILAVISWMAGVLYLPRLFVYHCGAGNNKQMNNTFKTMELKLFKYIIVPAMVISLITGEILAFKSGFKISFSNFDWYFVKVASVLLLVIYTLYLNYIRIQFKNDKNTKSDKYYRFLNEVPTVLMIIIVIAVVIKF